LGESGYGFKAGWHNLIRSSGNKTMTMPDFVAEVAAQEAALPLRNDRCRSRFWLHGEPTTKVFVFFHGLTAAPYQFETLGDRLYKAGYNVVVPLLPGHGQAGDWGPDNPPPLPEDIGIYQEFVLRWLDRAKALGQAVIVGGLSAGGTLAAWAAIAQADRVTQALLFAPYLSNSNMIVDLISNSSQGYFAWQDQADPARRTGYGGFRFPALKIFPTLGRRLLAQAESQTTAPMLIVSTETDQAVDNADHRALFDASQSHQPRTWYHCFPIALEIPHAMMAPEEGNQWTATLNTMVLAYTESQLTWAEVEELAYRMTQGKPFPQVVAELGVADRCSRDLPAFITMIDKRQIVIDRNPHRD
jgi:alpha-beta hydrolase superfamily lysophospholipase